jgi:parvulin-like peptidyl-prolyl isomerase
VSAGQKIGIGDRSAIVACRHLLGRLGPLVNALFFLSQRRGRIAALALAVGSALVAAGCQGGSGPAVTVNGHAISQADLDSELKAIAGNAPYVAAVEAGSTPIRGPGGQDTLTLAFTDRVLTRQLFLELVHVEILRRNIKVTSADIAKATTFEQNQLDAAPTDPSTGAPTGPATKVWETFKPDYQNVLAVRQAEIVDLQNALETPSTDPAVVKKFYDNNPALFTQNCVSHILVASQAQADSIRAQLVAGADFAVLAKQDSTDTGSNTKGGDLGCQPTGTYVPEFEAAIKDLPIGQLSPVVHSQFGYHIIKVTARKVTPFDQATATTAMQTDAQDKFNTFIMDAVAKAKVSVNRRYGTFTPTGNNAGINPPAPPPAAAGGPTTTAAPSSAAQTPASPVPTGP